MVYTHLSVVCPKNYCHCIECKKEINQILAMGMIDL